MHVSHFRDELHHLFQGKKWIVVEMNRMQRELNALQKPRLYGDIIAPGDMTEDSRLGDLEDLCELIGTRTMSVSGTYPYSKLLISWFEYPLLDPLRASPNTSSPSSQASGTKQA